MRTIVVGDIHGCGKALRSLLAHVQPQPKDTVVFLGDYVDRGPDSRGVVDQILELRRSCRVVALRGNHEIMMLAVMQGQLPADPWHASGGKATLTSYGGTLQRLPEPHLQFFRQLRPYYESERSIFVHAGYQPDLPMEQQTERSLYWEHLLAAVPGPHCSGKRVFVGHTPQASGAVLDLGHLVCMDTYCFGGRWLTAMHVESGQVWQADGHGQLRRERGGPFWRGLHRWFRSAKTSGPSNARSAGLPAVTPRRSPAADAALP